MAQRTDEITAGSLFSGIGAAELAFERCGVTTLWASEIDKTAASVYARHFPRTLQLGDIQHVGNEDAAPVDIVVGGSPCQDFSIAGKRTGLVGERSGLFYEYIRVIDELKPAFAIWENVPGALTSHAGRDFARILGAFQECGALDIAYRILDAQYFGVAQRRKRLFVVIDFRGNRSGEILFEPPGANRNSPPRRQPGTDIAYALTGSNQRFDASNNETFVGVTAFNARNGSESDRITGTLQDGSTLNAMPLITGTLRSNGSGLQYASTNNPGDYPVPEKAFTLRSGSGIANGLQSFNSNIIPTKAGTIRASGSSVSRVGSGEVQMSVPDSDRVRRLTPRECERLMGFPDDFTRWDEYGGELADTPRYRMLGNSMVVPVVEWIARRMVSVLRGE